MSTPCKNCKESIINQTPSLIGSTKCTDDCPEIITCENIYPAACMFYSGQDLPCTGINFGDRIDVALGKIEAGYGVRVTSRDTCCGYLMDKITSSTLEIGSTTDQNGCIQMTIDTSTSTACHQWTNVTFSSPDKVTWSNDDSQCPSQYSNVLNCKVALKGVVKATFDPLDPANAEIDSIIFNIPNSGGRRPSCYRRFSVNALISDGGDPAVRRVVPGLLTVNTNGNVNYTLIDYNPNVPITSSCTECSEGEPVATYEPYFGTAPLLTLTIGLDGLTYTP